MTSSSKYVPLFLSTALAMAGCTMEVGVEEDVARTESELYMAWSGWSNGTVPVCWTPASTMRANFAQEAQSIKDKLNIAWPRYANIEFTGWGTCPSSPGDTVQIEISSSTGCRSHGTAGYDPGDLDMLLCTNSGSWDGGLIAHEFGHVMGFSHEMARPDFDDDASGSCKEANVSGGKTLGTPEDDRDGIMSSTGYCNTNTMLGRWDIVGSRHTDAYGPSKEDYVLSDGTNLYARKRSNGDIYKRSGSSWTKIGGPGGQFVLVGTALYGMSPNASGIYKYSGSGTSWSKVGDDAREMFRCGTSLCATNPSTNKIYKYSGSGTSWSLIGDGGIMHASTSSTLYRLSVDRQKVDKYSGSGTTWTKVGGAASFVFATSNRLYATNPTSGDLYKYSGSGTSWSVAGGPGRSFVGVGSTLYGLSPDRGGIYKYSGSGTSWTNVGGAADWAYGGPSGSLYATNPSTKDIYKYSGSGTSWTKIGQP